MPDMSQKRKKPPRGLGQQLRAACVESGMTRFALAKRAGVSYAIVHRFAAAERDITLGTASKLADVLGLELKPTKR